MTGPVPTPQPSLEPAAAPKPVRSWTLRGEVITVALLLCLIWGEVGGIWYTFSRYGPDAGEYAIYMPPYAWYRNVECIWWFTFGGYDGAERKQVARLLEAIELQESALRADRRLGFAANRKDIEPVAAKLERSAQLAESLDPDVLAKLHYELPAMVRDNLAAGAREYATAIRGTSITTQMQNSRKLAIWTVWYDENHHKMWDKGLIDELADRKTAGGKK